MIRTLCCFAIAFASLTPVLAENEVRLNELTVRQWVQQDADGSVQGQIVLPAEGGTVKAVENAVVVMVDNEGKVLRAQAKTNAQGNFTFKNVQPGVYALSARADFVFACCAMHVVDAKTQSAQALPKLAEIAAANIDYTAVNRAIIRYLPPNVNSDVAFNTESLETITEARTENLETFRVAQTAGGLEGKLYRAGVNKGHLGECMMTNVFIMKDGQEITRTVTDGAGQFRIDNLEPGAYSLMAVGPDGLGMVGFELVDESKVQTAKVESANGERLIAQYGDCCCCQQVALQVAPCPQVNACVEECIISEEVIIEEPCCEVPLAEAPVDTYVDPGFGYAPGYGGGGYYGGGGGGGYAGGGLGGIAGLAGLGVAIAAVASDDDGVVVALPPSPIVP